MNIRRGVFRIWLLIAGLWVSVILIVSFFFVDRTLQNRFYEPTLYLKEGKPWEQKLSKPRKKLFIPFSEVDEIRFHELERRHVDERKQSASKYTFIQGWDETTLIVPNWVDAASEKRLRTAYKSQFWERWWLPAFKLSGLIVAPPLLLLGIGYALGWVVRGFKI